MYYQPKPSAVRRAPFTRLSRSLRLYRAALASLCPAAETIKTTTDWLENQ